MEKQVIMNGENAHEVYEAPKCEVIEMQNEGTILSASNERFIERNDNVW